jgi:subtilisin
MNIQEKFPNYQPNYLFPALAVIFSSIFVWGAFLYSRQEQRISLPPGSVVELHPAIARPVTKQELEENIATYSLSDITTVEAEVIEELKDENRKMITPKDEQDVEKIKEIVEAQGGTVISTNESTIVVDIPEEQTEIINQALEEEDVADEIEVDHPIFILSETDLWNIAKVDAPRAWEKTKGSGIKVGVIDTGVDYTHPELSGRFVGGYDNVNEDSDPMDGHGHGTHVAGIIASSLNNAGVVGVAPEVNLYAYKAIADSGAGYTSDLIESLDSAINDGIQTVNISLGTDQHSSTLENKLNQAVNQGMVIVAAAGNTGGGAVLYPAAYDSVISVTATDENDQFASFSSLGAEIAAPGVNVVSTVPGGGYATLSGTSMAAPHVTATSALLIANGTSSVRQTLYDTTVDLGSEGPDGIFGYGLLQTGESVVPTEPSPTPEIPTPTPTSEPSPIVIASPSPIVSASPSASPKIIEEATPSATPIVKDEEEATRSNKPIIKRRTKVDQSWFEKFFNKNKEEDTEEDTSNETEEKEETNQGKDEEHRSENSYLKDENSSKHSSKSGSSYEYNSNDEGGVERTVRTIFKAVSEIIKNRATTENKQRGQLAPSPTPKVETSSSPTPKTEEKETKKENTDEDDEKKEKDEDDQDRYSSKSPKNSRKGSVRGVTTDIQTEEKIFNLVWDLLKIIF